MNPQASEIDDIKNYDQYDVNDHELIYINDRPVWGPDLYNVGAILELTETVIEDVQSLSQKGGALVIPFVKNAERSLLMFLNLLSGQLYKNDYRVTRDYFLGFPYLMQPSSEFTVWQIHHAPRYQNLSMMLESWIKPGSIAILSGKVDLWQKSALKIPNKMISSFEKYDASFERELMNVLTTILEDIDDNKLLNKIHRLVCMCDAWGVPLPFEFLSRLVGQDPDILSPIIESAHQDEILFWVEREKPNGLLISNASEDYASQYLLNLAATNSIHLSSYFPIFDTIDHQIQEERYLALNLIQSWLADSKMRYALSPETFNITEIRKWILNKWTDFYHLIRCGNDIEQLVWSQCLTQQGLFEQGYEIIQKALSDSPNNVYLHQYHAHLLSEWSRKNPEKLKMARRIYAETTQICQDNVYLWQSQGNFIAQSKDPKAENDANTCFTKALMIDPENIPTLVARADMNLELGHFDLVEKDLSLAHKLDSHNLHVSHLRGRLAFFQGQWEMAENIWKKMVVLENHHVYALQSLGNMARVRGHWEKAHHYLQLALEADPENIPALLEYGILMRKWGLFIKETQTDQDIHSYLSKGMDYLHKALQFSPGNPKVIVAMSAMDRHMGQPESALEKIKALLSTWKDNIHAWMELSQCLENMDKLKEMDASFKKILSIQKRNFYVLFMIAKIATKHKDQAKAQEYYDRANRVWRDLKLPAHETINTLLEKIQLIKQIQPETDITPMYQEILSKDPENAFLKVIHEK